MKEQLANQLESRNRQSKLLMNKSVLEEIDRANKLELGSRKPVVEKCSIHYEWQDTSLLPLLSKGLSHAYRRSAPKEDEEAEKRAVSLANELVNLANKSYCYEEVEAGFKRRFSSLSGYAARRFVDIGAEVVEAAKARKGLLIYGEGGIGKTYFIYELAQELKAAGRPFAVAFDKSGVDGICEIGINHLAKAWPDGFTLMIDACNELDDETFDIARRMVLEALSVPSVNVVATTRKESPTARLDILKDILPANREFEGVEPFAVYDLLSECSDDFLALFQDMLFSRNPRSLNLMVDKISKMKPGEDGMNATIQRTTLIEESIKKPLSRTRWLQTKKICKLLYDSDSVQFSYNDVVTVLGDDADGYLTDMVEQGFVVCSEWEGLKYTFSSESQIRVVVARCLNDDLKAFPFDDSRQPELAKSVAKLVADKSGYMYQHEMTQVAVDRYCSHGITFILGLLHELNDLGVDFEFDRIMTQTIFPSEAGFKEAAKCVSIDPCAALYSYGGFLRSPFNLTNYANRLLLEKPGRLDKFFRERWQGWQLSNLIQRVRTVADYVGNSGRVPDVAASEWTWLAVWCSFSSNIKLRALSQRLLFVLCDVSDASISIARDAWNRISDVYVRRAISKTFSRLSEKAKSGMLLTGFAAEAAGDSSITDSVIISNICEMDHSLSPTNFDSRDYFSEFRDVEVSAEDLQKASDLVWRVDLISKSFFPFDIWQFNKGLIDLNYSARFMDAPISQVSEWNDGLSLIVQCPDDGECGGLSISPSDLEGVYPVKFEYKQLDSRRLLHCFVALLKKWLEFYGGNLEDMLGRFRALSDERDLSNNPNRKPVDLATCEFLGSLSANYYLEEMVLNGRGFNSVGFMQYEESAYNEPGETCCIMPAPNTEFDRARAKIAERIVSPAEKADEWFDDIDEVYSELAALIEPIELNKVLWRPCAVNARSKIKASHDLLRSNELLLSIAYSPGRHIDGGGNDRYLTIEHKEYIGNMHDYSDVLGEYCLQLPGLAEECTVRQRNPILLPPPGLVRRLGLEYDSKRAWFVDPRSHEPIIICDGNLGSYYEDSVHNLMLIREDVFVNLLEEGGIVYFAFSERFKEGSGYGNECDRHWEFSPGDKNPVHYLNTGGSYGSTYVPDRCSSCPLSEEARKCRCEDDDIEYVAPDWLQELLDDYRADDIRVPHV